MFLIPWKSAVITTRWPLLVMEHLPKRIKIHRFFPWLPVFCGYSAAWSRNLKALKLDGRSPQKSSGFERAINRKTKGIP